MRPSGWEKSSYSDFLIILKKAEYDYQSVENKKKKCAVTVRGTQKEQETKKEHLHSCRYICGDKGSTFLVIL